MPTFDEGHQRFTLTASDGRSRNTTATLTIETRLRNWTGRRRWILSVFWTVRHGDLYWIEVKDFRGYRIQNKRRLADGELAIEVAQKVRDSIAGIIRAISHFRGLAGVGAVCPGLCGRRDNRIRVVLWLEQDDMPSPPGVRKNQAQVLGQKLAEKLRWLTARVFVLSSATGGCPEGLVVTDLQGEGQP